MEKKQDINTSDDLFPQYQEGVIYVAPSGVAFDRKTFMRYYKTWKTAIHNIAEAAAEAVRVISEVVTKAWDSIKSIFDRLGVSDPKEFKKFSKRWNKRFYLKTVRAGLFQ